MKTIEIAISDRKALRFIVEDCDLRAVTLPFLVATLGEPQYVIKAGDVGEPRREFTVEPAPETVPVPETIPAPAPVTPVPA